MVRARRDLRRMGDHQNLCSGAEPRQALADGVGGRTPMPVSTSSNTRQGVEPT